VANLSVSACESHASSNSIILRKAGVKYWTEYAQMRSKRHVKSGESLLPAARSVHHWTY
jgi:hypothetical protein